MTRETEKTKQFLIYSSLLELRERLHSSISSLTSNSSHLGQLPKSLMAQLKKVDEALNSLYKKVGESIEKHKLEAHCDNCPFGCGCKREEGK